MRLWIRNLAVGAGVGLVVGLIVAGTSVRAAPAGDRPLGTAGSWWPDHAGEP